MRRIFFLYFVEFELVLGLLILEFLGGKCTYVRIFG